LRANQQTVLPIKILVFAHTPPPHHGQSVMVKLMLEALKWDERFIVHHVNAKVSDDMQDIGSFRAVKFLRLMKFVFEALRIRLKHGPMLFYYVPAPVKKSAILRDWIVMAICRPFFPNFVHHWHSCGLGEWTRNGSGFWQKWTWLSLRNAALSIVITDHNRKDAEAVESRKIVVVPNGTPDPCPDFSKSLEPNRQLRRHKQTRRYLFLAHCTEAKGLFDTIEAFALAKRRAWVDGQRRLELSIAGHFVSSHEKQRFLERIACADLQQTDGACSVTYVGFLKGKEKDEAFRAHDGLIYPSHWESFGLTVVEAAAYGLPSVVSDHPNLLSLLPEDLRFAAPIKNTMALSQAILKSSEFDAFAKLRRFFLEHYQASIFSSRITEAIYSA